MDESETIGAKEVVNTESDTDLGQREEHEQQHENILRLRIHPTNKKILREYDLKSVCAGFRSVRLWQYGIMFFSALVFFNMFAYQYKNLGLSVGISDSLLTIAGSISSLT